jgi:hypothetical protein
MTAEMLGWLGIVVSLIFGIAGLAAAKHIKRKQQNQKISGDGTGHQAGRDININKKL